MRKLYLVVFLTVIVSVAHAAATSSSTTKVEVASGKIISGKTPVGYMVQNFFRKIFTGKEQMSEKRMKRILRRQK